MSDLRKPEKRAPKPRRRISRGPIKRRRSPKGAVAKRRAAKRARLVSADAKWSRAVRAWYWGECAIGRHAATDAHHLFGKKAYPRLRHDVENGVALCRHHHDVWHANPEREDLLFAERNRDRYARLAAKAQRESRLA